MSGHGENRNSGGMSSQALWSGATPSSPKRTGSFPFFTAERQGEIVSLAKTGDCTQDLAGGILSVIGIYRQSCGPVCKIMLLFQSSYLRSCLQPESGVSFPPIKRSVRCEEQSGSLNCTLPSGVGGIGSVGRETQ